MNRAARRALAEETVAIASRGTYQTAAGVTVDISAAVEESLAATELFRPHNFKGLARGISESPGHRTAFDVRNETTLAVARRLVAAEEGEVGCLNFASAKNAGGGFLGGSQAQEESLARSSALYPTLLRCPEYYEANARCRTAFYTEHVIHSPAVPVFRDDDGTLLEGPYRVGFVTSPAVNAGAVRKNEPHREDEILPAMRRRIGHVLTVFAARGYRHVVLGAWGCGVFRQSPAEVAGLFAEALTEGGRFAGRFASVTFAVLDRDDDGPMIAPFRDAFGRDPRQ